MGGGLLDDPEPEPEPDWTIVPFTDPQTSTTYNIIDGRVIVAFRNPPQLPLMDPNYFDVERSANDPCYQTGYTNFNTPAIQAFLAAENLTVYSDWPEIACLGVTLPPGGTVLDAVVRWPVQYTSLIEAIDTDALISTEWPGGDDVPNDEQWQYQWNINESPFGWPTGVNKFHINIQQAWRQGWLGGSNVVTAVLDTGVDYNGLYDMRANSTPMGAFTGDRWNSTRIALRSANEGGQPPYPTQNLNSLTAKIIGHGTCVASILAAGTNNEFSPLPIGDDLAGISQSCRYFPVAMRYMAYSDANRGYSRSAILNAYAVLGAVKRCYYPPGVHMSSSIPYYNLEVVNCSFTCASPAESERRDIYNLQRYMLFVCAQGNDGASNTCGYPARYGGPPYNFFGVMSVVAYDLFGNRSIWGNESSNYYYIPEHSIAAPGSDIRVLDLPGLNIHNDILGYDPGYVDSSGGTSLAAPHVSAVAALLASDATFLTPSNIRNWLIIRGQADLPGDLSGFRRLDAYNVLDLFN